MRVSELYSLNRTQSALDFVDVDVDADTPLFLNPTALESLPSEWGDECVHLVQHYFRHVLSLIQNGRHTDAEALLSVLREPNETHLGMSVGKSRGRALGDGSAHSVWTSLSQSNAAQTGLLEDLEDTVLLIDGISIDIISDITTNIIRGPLIRYTQMMCDWLNIPMEQAVNSGPMWDVQNNRWYSELVRLPVTATGRLILVPKAIVRQHLNFDPKEYYTHYVLKHLQEVEMSAGSGLVQLLKNGKHRVTKKSLKEKYGTASKEVSIVQTRAYPEVLMRYKSAKRHSRSEVLTHEDIASAEATPAPNWDQLLENVLSIPAGTERAEDYEKAVESLFTALFYPSLAYPVPQHKIHASRKRIDITYTNIAKTGFFNWVGMHYPASHVFVECKNYGSDIANPALDQMSGRFSPSRGRFGIIVCRGFENKALFLSRCKDTAGDDRGWIIPIDDDDLRKLVVSKKEDPDFDGIQILRDQFNFLIN